MSGRAPSNAVFIGNISYDVTEQQLHEIFSAAGPIKNIRIMAGKGYAFCTFHDIATAEAAIRNFNQHELAGRNLHVNYAEGHSASRGGDRGGNKREREGQEDYREGARGPPAANQPMGFASTSAMANSLNGPQPTAAAGPSQDTLSISGALGDMNPLQLFEVTAQMKALVQQNPAAARQVLISQPHITQALFKAQILLGMVKPPPTPQPQQQPMSNLVQQQPMPQQQPPGLGPTLQPAMQQPAVLHHPQPQHPFPRAQPPSLPAAPPPPQPFRPVIPPPAPPASGMAPNPAPQGGVPPPQAVQSGPLPVRPAMPPQVPPVAQAMTTKPILQSAPQQQPVLMPATQQPQQQQQQPMVAVAPQQQQQQQQQPPAAGGSSLLQGQQQALLQRLMSFTPAQLDALPPLEKAQAVSILNIIRGQQKPT